MTSFRCFLFLSFISFLLMLTVLPSISKANTNHGEEEDDEILHFLEQTEGKTVDDASLLYPSDSDHEAQSSEDDDEDEEIQNEHDLNVPIKASAIDDKDVVVLTKGNFSDFIENNKFVMIGFYAPWCGHSQVMAPEYAAAATELKGEGVFLAKVDATVEDDLAHEYDVQAFPTIHFFVHGKHQPYPAARNREAIVTWIKRNTGPGVSNVTTLNHAERILNSQSKVALAYLNSLVGPESEELAASSKLQDDIAFYQTVNPDVAKLFHIDPHVKRPALVLIKKEAEKISYFDGQFVKAAISEFITSNKLPLVTIFNRENAPSIFGNSIKKNLLLFATLNISEKFIPVFQEAAKLFRGKLIFIYVQVDNEDSGRPVADFFDVNDDGPRILAYSANDARKYAMDGDVSVTLDTIKAFAEDFLQDGLKPFYKSDPIPETNDEDVKVVVGNSFDDIVLDESKDVLLKIYTPFCRHCQSLESMYNKLAKHLKGIDSLVIAKMDASTNQHPRAPAQRFPTILFYPAGNKSSDPITVNTERTVVAYYKFLKKHASVPFKLHKPASSYETKSPSSEKSSSEILKDDL